MLRKSWRVKTFNLRNGWKISTGKKIGPKRTDTKPPYTCRRTKIPSSAATPSTFPRIRTRGTLPHAQTCQTQLPIVVQRQHLPHAHLSQLNLLVGIHLPDRHDNWGTTDVYSRRNRNYLPHECRRHIHVLNGHQHRHSINIELKSCMKWRIGITWAPEYSDTCPCTGETEGHWNKTNDVTGKWFTCTRLLVTTEISSGSDRGRSEGGLSSIGNKI